MSIHAYTEDRPVEHPATIAAPISGKCLVSTRAENRYSSETPAVKGGFSVNEWLPSMRCKLFISNMFLFE